MPASRLSERVATRLAQAEICELNAHYRDDLRIARLTVLHAGRGDAVLCSPFVLSTYEVLGLHPSKVWPKILERRKAQGIGEKFWRDLPPKKPPVSAVGRSHVKLWCEKTNGARAVNSRAAGNTVLREPTISVPMAAPSIAALYPNPDAPSSAKTRQFSYDELLALVMHSGAPLSVKIGTIAAISARGRWPKQDGPVTYEICVSLLGMMLDGTCCRRTAQRRAKRACQLGFWRRTRNLNSWLPCPKCSSERSSSTCPKCGHKGNSRNLAEFRRPFTYEIDVEKFRSAPRPREIHHFDVRTYVEYREAAKRGEHPNVTEMPRKPAEPAPTPDPKPPATAKPVEPMRKTAEHRNAGRSLTPRQTQELARRIEYYEQGNTKVRDVNGWVVRDLKPGEGNYIKPLPRDAAVLAACKSMAQGDESRGLESLNCTMQRAVEAAKEMEQCL